MGASCPIVLWLMNVVTAAHVAVSPPQGWVIVFHDVSLPLTLSSKQALLKRPQRGAIMGFHKRGLCVYSEEVERGTRRKKNPGAICRPQPVDQLALCGEMSTTTMTHQPSAIFNPLDASTSNVPIIL